EPGASALALRVRLLAHGRTGSRRVRRADVEDGGEHGDERLADPRQLLDRDVRLVELPVAHALLDDALHEAADAARRRLGERARGALDAVGKHQDRGLLGTRPRARVAVVLAAGRR